MKDEVKKIINFRFDRYKETENKLEKLAAKGLVLDRCGTFLWTFRKGEPKNLKYTITYFYEGSIFNPGITDNQSRYFDYAKAAGWNFVTQMDQMQIFSSEEDNPIPFETDEKEKFDNIKRCMRKIFLPSTIIMLLIFIFNLVVQFNSFKLNPIDFLSNPSKLVPALVILQIIIYEVYSLFNYFIWCKCQERSIADGGECTENRSMMHMGIDITFMCFIFGSFFYLFIQLSYEISWFGLLFCIVQMPIMLILFSLSIKYMKKKKASATINKVVTCTLLVVVNFTYIALIGVCIFKFGFSTDVKGEYRTVNWQMAATESYDYKLYSDKIPLTCEDLYGDMDYDYYSYEKELNSTFFITKNNYRQDSLPAKDAPPRIEYDIIEPQFDFVYNLSKKHLLEIPEWQNNTSFHTIDNEMFGTMEAYQEYYDDTPTGKYILLFNDKIILLSLEEEATREQIPIIIEKLKI